MQKNYQKFEGGKELQQVEVKVQMNCEGRDEMVTENDSPLVSKGNIWEVLMWLVETWPEGEVEVNVTTTSLDNQVLGWKGQRKDDGGWTVQKHM